MRLPLIATALALTLSGPALAQDKLLNVSYDIARELFGEINPLFVEHWKQQSGKEVKIVQSFAGSSPAPTGRQRSKGNRPSMTR